ncbi:MAG: hypothetical protein WC629_00275 [Candidatus Paceibacterota bacterium]|jgi:uncharacterized protein YoxC
MTEIAKSDAFFFITSIAIVIIGIAMVAFIIYSFFIVRKINKFVDEVKEEGGEVIEDVHEFRMKLKKVMLFSKLFKNHKK